ncbi:Elongator complex protein 1 [Schistosoma japonicum]|nr:Elongator complex protein 1 [Schistosoma japonicum]
MSSCSWLEGCNVRHISLNDCSDNITVSFEQSIELIGNKETHIYRAPNAQQKIHSCYPLSPPVYLVACLDEIFLCNSLNHQIYDKLILSTELRAICVSPDLSKIALVTGDGIIYILSSTLETISRFSLHEKGFGSALSVSLGWGKKETQFHGSEGKEAALTKPILPVLNTQYDDGRFEIAWRDDGLYFAVSWIDQLADNRRRIRVYNDTGELFSTTNIIDSISPGLCWRPHIRLITTVQRREGHGLDIIFFESNSQRHGEFELISNESEKFYQVKTIVFNPTGSILAVLCNGTENHPWFNTVEMNCFAYSVIPPPMFATRLVFYSNTNQNNQTLCSFPPYISSVSIPSVWLTNELNFSNGTMPMLIQTATCQSSNQLFPNMYFLTITNGTTLEEESFCNGEVHAEWHNGAQNVAPWPKTVVKINMDKLFGEYNNDDYTDETLKYLAFSELQQKHIHVFNPLSCFTWLSLYEVCFIAADGLLLGYLNIKNVCADGDSNCCASGRWLLRASSCDVHEFKTPTERGNTEFTRITSICYTIDGRVCVHMSNSNVYIYPVQDLLGSKCCYEIIQSNSFSIDDLHLCSPLNCTIQFPSACDQLLCIPVFDQCRNNTVQLNPSNYNQYSALLLLGFNKSMHRLFGAVLPKNKTAHFQQCDIIAMNITDLCSSLVWLSEFLLVTNIKKLLICVSLFFDSLQINDPNSLLKELLLRLNIPSELDISTRKPPRNWYSDNLHPIESGSVIVTAIPNDTKVILQMPRGNLEEIHPRALAVKMMRRHRINFNLVHDHNPNLFLSNINGFLQSVGDPDLITLFVTDLVEEDVTETIYHKFYLKSGCNRSVSANRSVSTSKLDRITDLLIEEMEKYNPTKLIVPIITCYVKKVPPNYEAALMRLKRLFENGDISTWNNGLRHLQYFSTPIELYKVALGTYDLDFATTMAQRTQLDPKEYLAELNELRSLTSDLEKSQCGTIEEAVAYQQFKIDHSLKKHSKAVLHLIESGPMHKTELLSYVKTYHLYAQVTEVLPRTSKEFKIICQFWADYLIASQNLIYAGQIYMKGGFYGLAARTFLSATNAQLWCTAAAYSRQMNDNKNDGDSSTDEYLKAIQIYIDFLEDPVMAIRTACEDCLWMDAHRLASLYNKQEFLNQIIKSSLTEHYSIMKERLLKSINAYDKLFDRLITLRRMHKEQAETQQFVQMHGDTEYLNDNFSESDITSDTSSLSGESITSSMSQGSLRTLRSRKSRRSMKTKRKQEAKKWSSKPGSKYEEVGLLHELTQSIELGQILANEVINSLTEFWNTNMFEEGRTLIRLTNDLLKKQKQELSCIWDDWTTGKCTTEGNEHQFFGRKKYSVQGR